MGGREIRKYEHGDLSLETVSAMKSGREVYAVFSTCGDREAGIIGANMALICELCGGLVDRIFLSHRRLGDRPDATELAVMELDAGVEIVLANEIDVPDMLDERGKGADMRRWIYRMNSECRGRSGSEIVIIFLDSDVLPGYFGRHFAVSLAGAVLDGADFAKGGFWREKGRVKKFTAQPLFSIIDHPELKLLTQFSYPLSGECAGTLDFFNSVSFWQMYGVETGMLLDAVMGGYSLADVNLGRYDHWHHDDMAIQKMSFSIMRVFLKSLCDHGIIAVNSGSAVSDTFSAEYIDGDCRRNRVMEHVRERKYRPLKDILGG